MGGGKNKTTAVVATDFNNQRDIDFLVVNYGSPAQLFSNQRDGSFKEVAAQARNQIFSGQSLGVAAGDLNKDSFTDFYLPNLDQARTILLYLSDGRGGFKRRRGSVDDAGGASRRRSPILTTTGCLTSR